MDTAILKNSKRAVLAVAAACLLVSQGSAAAGDSGWALSLAGGMARSDFEASYSHRFETVVEYQLDSNVVGAQDLLLKGRDGSLWQLGLERSFGRRFGGQVLLGMGSFEIEGTSSPLEIGLQYTSTQPPDYIPTPAEYTESFPWTEPQGDLELEYLCVNVGARFWTDKKTGLVLSGGPTLYSVEAEFESLGYVTYWQGGHGVLFAGTYDLKAESARARDIGANVGIGLDLRVSERIGVLAEARAFVLSTVDVRLEPTKAFRIDEDREVPVNEIASRLSLEPLHIDPSFVSFSVGARVSL